MLKISLKKHKNRKLFKIVLKLKHKVLYTIGFYNYLTKNIFIKDKKKLLDLIINGVKFSKTIYFILINYYF